MIHLFNQDCLPAMKEYPDKWFELAIVDPEFGIGIGNSHRLVLDKGLPAKDWDNRPISPIYFDEIYRISLNQIIWGGNYYALPPTKHCIGWDKLQPEALSFYAKPGDKILDTHGGSMSIAIACHDMNFDLWLQMYS